MTFAKPSRMPKSGYRIKRSEIAWLSPKPPIIVDGQNGEKQDCLLACYALAHPSPVFGALHVNAAWALEISDHCAGRLLQRAPDVDLRSAALEAALAFAAADAKTVEPLIGTDSSIYLPTGAGSFIGLVSPHHPTTCSADSHMI
jgi:hypothetical protein